MITLTGTPKEIRIAPSRAYIMTVDGGSATVEEFRNGDWRPSNSLANGTTSDPTFFHSKNRKIRVSGSGEFSLQQVTL